MSHAVSHPCPQEWGSVGLEDLEWPVVMSPLPHCQSGPLPTGVPVAWKTSGPFSVQKSYDPGVSVPLELGDLAAAELGIISGNPSHNSVR